MHSPKLNIQIPLKCTILVYGPIITLGTCITAVRLILCVCELRVCSSWIQSWQIKSSSHCQSSSLKSLVVDRKSQREEWQEDARRRASGRTQTRPERGILALRPKLWASSMQPKHLQPLATWLGTRHLPS